MFDHPLGGGLCDQLDALQIGVDDRVPGTFILLERGLGRGDAGIVDDAMDRAEAGLGQLQRFIDGRRLRHIHRRALRAISGGLDLGNGRCQRLRAPRRQRHLRAIIGKEAREMSAEPAGAAGRLVGDWHQATGFGLLVAIGIHVAAAFIYPFVFRDRIMQRMLPRA